MVYDRHRNLNWSIRGEKTYAKLNTNIRRNNFALFFFPSTVFMWLMFPSGTLSCGSEKSCRGLVKMQLSKDECSAGEQKISFFLDLDDSETFNSN